MKHLIGVPGKKSKEDYMLSSKLNDLLTPVSKEITQAKTANSLLSYIAIEDYDAIWIKWSMIEDYYIRFHDRYKKLNKFIPIVIIIEDDNISGALCQKNDVIFSIIKESELASEFQAVLNRLDYYEIFKKSLPPIASRFIRSNGFGLFIGNSSVMTRLYSQILKVSSTDFTVLILGESGSGKEIVAKSIHEYSLRKDFPFVSLNCAAIPENLLESELFGYEKGAFTGANKSKAGKFEVADNGTIFLDEIGDMAPDLQAKLLRVLEDKTIERLGGTVSKKVNIRLLAATNKDLLRLVKEEKFRMDLYHRLNVIPLKLQPIREREDDITLLILHMMWKLTKNSTLKIDGISMELINHLKSIPLKGNVRELENLITRLIFYSDSTIIGLKGFEEIQGDSKSGMINEKSVTEPTDEVLPLKMVEKNAIEIALKKLNGHITNVANALQISRGALYKKIKEYKLR